jgi:nucleotide-binding universal stress UspA family protein
MSIYLAYDGSINANWIARYGVRMAANHPEKCLHVVYIEDADVRAPDLSLSLKQIQDEAQAVGVEARLEVRPMRHGVYGGLVEHIPAGPETFVICGARVKKGRSGFLTGTISEQLLSLRQYNVLALHVVQPGLLGLPRNVLVPVSGDPKGLKAGLSILALMTPDIQRLHLLKIIEQKRSPFRLQSPTKTKQQRALALTYVRAVETELTDQLTIAPEFVDSHVGIGENWARETIIQSSRLNAGLIFIEATRDSLTHRFLFSDEIERLIGEAPCDVAVYRGVT